MDEEDTDCGGSHMGGVVGLQPEDEGTSCAVFLGKGDASFLNEPNKLGSISVHVTRRDHNTLSYVV